jgi:hypothetical protein
MLSIEINARRGMLQEVLAVTCRVDVCKNAPRSIMTAPNFRVAFAGAIEGARNRKSPADFLSAIGCLIFAGLRRHRRDFIS